MSWSSPRTDLATNLFNLKIVENVSFSPYELFKVSEYPFKQNRSVLKNMTVLLHTHFYNTSLNVPGPIFFNVYNLPILRSPNIRKIKVNNVGPPTNCFSYFMSPCTNRIAVFNKNFFTNMWPPREKQNRARDFFLSKLVELLQKIIIIIIIINKKMNNSLLQKMRARFCAAFYWKCVCKV